MFTFQWPWMGLLLVLPLVVRWLAPAKNNADTPVAILFPHLDILGKTFGRFDGQSDRKNPAFLILMALLWFGLVGALMRPQYVDNVTQVHNKGYDIMLAVDMSGSMRALDFSTQTETLNRLDVSKKVVGQFVRDRAHDRIGLVLFGDTAYQYSPLTPDTESVAAMLNESVIGMAGEGTAIGDAIGAAVQGLRDRPENSRIIVLLTDGEDTASTIPPLQAAQLAKDYGIRIYTIGIGSTGNVPFPTRNGRIAYANVKLDEGLLKQIAETTGGSYFFATNTQALASIYDRIDMMEKSEAETQSFMIRTPLYRYPLGLALFALMVLVTTPLLRKGVRHVD